MEKLILVFDCGATNVRVVAMNSKGEIAASHSFPNRTVEDPSLPGGRIWDLSEIWGKLCKASREVVSKINTDCIAGVTVTTFGVDGAFLDARGDQLYPIISWQCERTNAIMEGIDKYLPLSRLYELSGVYPYNFNTINKMIWFKENRPDVLDKASDFLFMPSLLINLLSGERVNDVTMLGTSMLGDIHNGDYSPEILDSIGISADLFPKTGNGGEIVGKTTSSAHEATGIPVGIPVCLSGHDTQYAVFGSGASEGQPVLSSGTWEILMCRANKCTTGEQQLKLGITNEMDAVSGKYNLGLNWIGSGLLEWVRKNFYGELTVPECYPVMIEEAQMVPPGSNGITVNPDFYNAVGGDSGGAIKGLHLNSTRAEIYRACLESLAYKLKDSLDALEKSGDFEASKIICVGGGSKNSLWNQIRADVCNVPIELIQQKETTVLGAAQFAFASLGYYKSVEEARAAIDYKPQIVNPSENASYYDQVVR